MNLVGIAGLSTWRRPLWDDDDCDVHDAVDAREERRADRKADVCGGVTSLDGFDLAAVGPDPAGPVDGLNLYEYVSGNPVRLVDPEGMQGDDACVDQCTMDPIEVQADPAPSGSTNEQKVTEVGTQQTGEGAQEKQPSISFEDIVREAAEELFDMYAFVMEDLPDPERVELKTREWFKERGKENVAGTTTRGPRESRVSYIREDKLTRHVVRHELTHQVAHGDVAKGLGSSVLEEGMTEFFARRAATRDEPSWDRAYFG